MSAVWQYFDKLPDSQCACKSCGAVLTNSTDNSSNMFHHLMKKHPALYREAKLQARHAGELDGDDEVEEHKMEGLKREKSPGCESEEEKQNNIVKTSTEPKLAILSFMSEEMTSQQCYPFDARLLCWTGSVNVHRLTLAAMSPLLATVMNNDAEEVDFIFVEGTNRDTLVELVNLLYRGGTPSAECASLIETLQISPLGIPKDFKLPVSKYNRPCKVKEEEDPEELLDLYNLAPAYLDEDEEEEDDLEDEEQSPKRRLRSVKLDREEKQFLSRLQDMFTPLEGEKLLSCTLCNQATEPNSECMLEHFSLHPEELDVLRDTPNPPRRYKARKKQRSKVWNYFERLEDTKARCKKCGITVKINMGSTTQMIYHLRTKHEDEYEGFETTNDVLDPDVLEEAEDADTSDDKKKRTVKRRSKIWFYFRYVSEGISECKDCGKRITMAKQARGSTSGLIHHLKHHHRNLYSVFQAIKETQCATKDQFNEISSGVKIEEEPPHSEPRKKIKKIKKLKKVIKKKRLRVWGYFTAVSDTWAQCNECEENVSMDHGSTSMMIHHLKREHPELYKQYDGDRDTKPELVMCEYCSETYDKRKMLQHHFDNHYDSWVDGAKARYEVVKEKLRLKYESGPYYLTIKSYYSPANIESGALCKFCHTLVQRGTGQMEPHIRCAHPEIELPEQMSLSCWFLATPKFGKINCNLCGAQFECEGVYSCHITETHKAESLDLQDWEDVLTTTSGPFAFKTAVLLEKYDKTYNYWENTAKPSSAEYGKLEDPVFRTCCECRKVFSTYSAMRYHQRVVHSGDKPFKCDMCEKAFNRKDTLESHLSSHSDLKPFMCSVCGKQFGRRHIRDTHERRHKGEKKYGCSMCTKRFMSSQQLKNHIRVHTGEKPFSCEHCGRMFAVKHQLVTHLRIHTGERPYGCEKCDQKFKHLSTRRNHKCMGDIKHVSQQDAVDVREFFRVPIPQSYHASI